MKIAMTLIAVVVLVCGCVSQGKLDSIRAAVDAEQITGMDKDTRFEYCLKMGIPGGPSDTHPGPYHSIDDINVNIQTGQYLGQDATFFLGKSRETGTWEVFSVMVKKEGKWEAIPPTQLN